jgi:hypothetical protein
MAMTDPNQRTLQSALDSIHTCKTTEPTRVRHWRHDFPLSYSLFSTHDPISAMSELESRSRPIQRHTGFEVGGHLTDSETSGSFSSRVRTTTSGTIVKGSDGDVEMGDVKVRKERGVDFGWQVIGN